MTISRQLYANNAKTTLASAAIPSDNVLQVSDGSRFPNPVSGDFFAATLEAGSNIEVVYVFGRTGNTFTGVIRGQEDTIASNFPGGTRIDNRVTRDTMSAVARKVDILDEKASLDLLDSPANSNSASYICHGNDDSGNPIIAIKNTSTSWRFNTHRIVSASGSAISGTTTSITSTGLAANLLNVVAGKYIIQFLTGSNAGLARRVISSGTNTCAWSTALPNPVSSGDQYEVYKSDASIITDLINSADDSLVFAIILGE